MNGNDLNILKKQMDTAHRELIESPNELIDYRLGKYLDLKERYFIELENL